MAEDETLSFGSSSYQGVRGPLHYALHPWELLLAFYRVKFLKIELAVVLFMFSRHLYRPLYQQYYYLIDGSDILQNTNFSFPNGTFCVSSELIDQYTGNNNSYKEDESFSNHLVAYGQIATTVPAVLVTLVMGPVMDRFGRRIGIILPVVGLTLQGVFSLFIIKYTLNPYYFVIANFIGGLFGSFTCVLAASFSYIADISSLRWRSLRVGIVESAIAFGGGAGTFLTGYWLRQSHCNFIPPMWLYIGCNLLLGVYVILLVPESLSRSERKRLQSTQMHRKGPRAFVEGFRLYFGGLSLASTWKLYVCSILLIVALLNMYGSSLIEVYFLKALPFDFHALQIGIFQSVRDGSKGIANFVFIALLVALKVDDSWVLLLATFAHGVCNVLMGLATKTWELFASK